MYVRSGTELINPFKLLERVGIREGQNVADLGCGSLGHFVFPAAQMVGGKGKVFAVDIQRSVLMHIERLSKEQQFFNVYPVWSDIDVYRATHITPESLDITLLINNLFLSQNRAQLVREMARLTRPGGRIVIVEWKPMSSPIGPASDQRLSKEQSRNLLASPLMTYYDDFEAGPYHYGLIYLRTEEPVEPAV